MRDNFVHTSPLRNCRSTKLIDGHFSPLLVFWPYVPSSTNSTSLNTNGTPTGPKGNQQHQQLPATPPTWPRLRLGIQAVMRAPPPPPRTKGHLPGDRPRCVKQMKMLLMNLPVSAKVTVPGSHPTDSVDQRHSAPPTEPANAVNKPVARVPTR